MSSALEAPRRNSASPAATGVMPSRDEAVSAGLASSVQKALQELRRELGQLENEAAASGWTWDPVVSRRVDALHVQLEGERR